ncbi:hypothetical protein H2198_008734 [Neophaeococcomyces mojaviensis]|uniref:Uncharacterized protein n=1 Tax=Neophaeococcomyces mojaviensis TaxID=3383035 RepID=A0ACC2ZWL2_9EURO|nr:hypothetical protein H2198_008734 [Knufia sp. JES_112]
MSQPHNIRPEQDIQVDANLETQPSQPEPLQTLEETPTDEDYLAREASVAHLEATQLGLRDLILQTQTTGVIIEPERLEIERRNERTLGEHREMMGQRTKLNQLLARANEHPFPPQQFSVQEISELYWTARAGQLDVFLGEVVSTLRDAQEVDSETRVETDTSALERAITAWQVEVPVAIKQRVTFMENVKFATTGKNESSQLVKKLLNWFLQALFWLRDVGRLRFDTVAHQDQQHAVVQLRAQRDPRLLELGTTLDGFERSYRGEKKWEIVDAGFEDVFVACRAVLIEYTEFRDKADQGTATQAEWCEAKRVTVEAIELVIEVRDRLFGIERAERNPDFDPIVNAIRERTPLS